MNLFLYFLKINILFATIESIAASTSHFGICLPNSKYKKTFQVHFNWRVNFGKIHLCIFNLKQTYLELKSLHFLSWVKALILLDNFVHWRIFQEKKIYWGRFQQSWKNELLFYKWNVSDVGLFGRLDMALLLIKKCLSTVFVIDVLYNFSMMFPVMYLVGILY